jgi:chemotaxis protein histidine kinase CheA
MPEMPDDELRHAVNAICTRLQSDFEAELTRLTTRLGAEREAAVADARQHAEALVAERTAEAARAASQAKDDEWSAKLEASRKEWEQRLERELEQQQTQADDHLLEEMARLRGELDEAAARAVAERDAALKQELQSSFQDDLRRAVEDATTRVREELEAERARASTALEAEKASAAGALDQERARLAGELDAVRASLQHDLDTERTRHAAEIAAERDRASSLTIDLERARAAAAELENSQRRAAELTNALAAASRERDEARAAVAERQAQPAMSAAPPPAGAGEATIEFAERLLAAIRTIDSARSLSDALTALTTAAGAFAPRTAVLIVQGGDAQVWRTSGFNAPTNQRLPLAGLIGRAVSTVNVVSTTTEAAPAFAALSSDRFGLAVPVTVGGQSVAVLYADDAGTAGDGAGERATWPGAMQVLAAHASTCLSQITASRTSQALQASRAGGAANGPGADDESSARRYARLLVSEIKLYNESAVRLGREKRDLLARLRPEIDRARHLFEERVSPSIARRSAFFHDELVHTLADGDSALLGSA